MGKSIENDVQSKFGNSQRGQGFALFQRFDFFNSTLRYLAFLLPIIYLTYFAWQPHAHWKTLLASFYFFPLRNLFRSSVQLQTPLFGPRFLWIIFCVITLFLASFLIYANETVAQFGLESIFIQTTDSWFFSALLILSLYCLLFTSVVGSAILSQRASMDPNNPPINSIGNIGDLLSDYGQLSDSNADKRYVTQTVKRLFTLDTELCQKYLEQFEEITTEQGFIQFLIENSMSASVPRVDLDADLVSHEDLPRFLSRHFQVELSKMRYQINIACLEELLNSGDNASYDKAFSTILRKTLFEDEGPGASMASSERTVESSFASIVLLLYLDAIKRDLKVKDYFGFVQKEKMELEIGRLEQLPNWRDVLSSLPRTEVNLQQTKFAEMRGTKENLLDEFYSMYDFEAHDLPNRPTSPTMNSRLEPILRKYGAL